jgi:FLVCR family feline leukemia virus subgroup C receptor-related protein
MDSLPFSLTAIFNFFIGAGLGGTYSILLESLMEKHYPV